MDGFLLSRYLTVLCEAILFRTTIFSLGIDLLKRPAIVFGVDCIDLSILKLQIEVVRVIGEE
mgnify:CR=1 FL=1